MIRRAHGCFSLSINLHSIQEAPLGSGKFIVGQRSLRMKARKTLQLIQRVRSPGLRRLRRSRRGLQLRHEAELFSLHLKRLHVYQLIHLVRVRVADYRAFLSGSRVPPVRPASVASPPPGPPERSVRDERPLTDLLSEITTEAS